MDNTLKYKQVIIHFLESLALKTYANAPGIKKTVIADTQRNHFQLINIGWDKGVFYFNPSLHFDIIDGKVWVQFNDTELEIGDELASLGIQPEDIIFGFLPLENQPIISVPAV